MFTAIINTPGYLPMEDEPAVFPTSGEAWEYLAQERREAEDSLVIPAPDDAPYSRTVDELDAYASSGHGPDTVYGDTPGYDGEHDLGVAYSVAEI